MNKIFLIKEGAKLLGGFGVSTVITNAVRATTPVFSSKMSKIGTFVGTQVLTYIATDLTSKYIEVQIVEFKKKLEDETNS